VFRERAEDVVVPPPLLEEPTPARPAPVAASSAKPAPQKGAQKSDGPGLMDRIRGLFKDWM
jgi:hypothetical protein